MKMQGEHSGSFKVVCGSVLIALFLHINAAFSQSVNLPYSVSDGPYLFYEDDILAARWIRNDRTLEIRISSGNFDRVKKKLKLDGSFDDFFAVNKGADYFDRQFTDADSIAVITDVHGDYRSYSRLLRAAGVVDRELRWKFGKGHLVVLGDIFDRGDRVTEILWHLFYLEKEAERAGGMVHLLLGNHEMMMFNNDFRYTNIKYRKVIELLGLQYPELYSFNTVLGRWLRLKPVVVSINKILFTHGGLSAELAREKVTIAEINRISRDLIPGNSVKDKDMPSAGLLSSPENDPLWFRGYFRDNNFCENTLDSILLFYRMDHIVVGHTSLTEITSLYGNRVIGVDAGIMNDEPGEVLIIKEGAFYRCFLNGRREKLAN